MNNQLLRVPKILALKVQNKGFEVFRIRQIIFGKF